MSSLPSAGFKMFFPVCFLLQMYLFENATHILHKQIVNGVMCTFTS